MLRQLNYNYRGQPLTPYGKGRSRYGKGRKSPGFYAFLAVVLLLLAGLCYWGYRAFNTPQKKNETRKTEEDQTEQLSDIPSPENMETTGGGEADPLPSAENESASIQSGSVEEDYRKAERLFQASEYEKSRAILRVLIENGNMGTGHPLYEKSCDLLGKSSMLLLHSGGEPANWVEYTVAPGNNLSVLAKKFHTSVSAIRDVNQLTSDKLRVGQHLRIPQCTWSLRIDRKNNRILLDNNGKLFKVYCMYVGPGGKALKSGAYQIKYKQANPDWRNGNKVIAGRSRQNPLGCRWLGLTHPGTKDVAGIHGTTKTTKQNKIWFALSEGDVQDLYMLVPNGTKVEILE